MAKKPSTARVKSRAKASKREPAHATTGLAALAGGWPGSDDLVKELAKIRRTPPRRLAKFD